MKSYVYLAVSTVALAVASNASAQSNSSTVNQSGTDGAVTVTQTAAGNAVTVSQNTP